MMIVISVRLIEVQIAVRIDILWCIVSIGIHIAQIDYVRLWIGGVVTRVCCSVGNVIIRSVIPSSYNHMFPCFRWRSINMTGLSSEEIDYRIIGNLVHIKGEIQCLDILDQLQE